MSESSGRILVDRSVIRLDGRPFFSYGPRVLLTPVSGYRAVLQQIAESGFTVVGSPPCSPGTLPQIHAFFDAAEEIGLMVILIADPRLPEHGRYMADQFRNRRNLHSYMLAPRSANRDGFESYIREQDNLRAQDLFHPIYLPLTKDHLTAQWLRTQDLYVPLAQPREPTAGRITHQRTADPIRAVQEKAAAIPNRPCLIPALNCMASSEARALGVYTDDPWVARFPPNPIDWFPYLAGFGRAPRRDLLEPQPEIIRLQIYDALCEGARGILLDFQEAFGGQSPFTGHDRHCEASIIAQEISVLRDFFAEGRIDPVIPETGHPRLRASMIRHGHEQLIVMRLEGYEEDYFVDEAYMERTEIELHGEFESPLHAWRLDFHETQRLEIVRESSGTIRFLAGPLELTGLVLLSAGTQRSEKISRDLYDRLPWVARWAVQLVDVRFAKLSLIEGELQKLGVGVDNRERLQVIDKAIGEAQSMIRRHDYPQAYIQARSIGRMSRQIIKYQMARALASPVYERGSLMAGLRSSYFLLPRFYREGAIETARAFTDLT